MKTLAILSNIRKRVPWYSMKTVFSSLDLPRGMGWDSSIVKVGELIQANPSLDEEFSAQLIEYYEEQVLCGEKAVQLYKLDTQSVSSILAWAGIENITESPFSQSYPTPLTEAELSELIDQPTLVKINNAGERVQFVFCTARQYEEQMQLQPDDLKSEVVENYELNDHIDIVVKRKRVRQFYDVIVLDIKNEVLQIRIDWGLGLKNHEAHKSILLTLKKFKEMHFSSQQLGLELDAPLNLFPLISKLYKDSSVGRVCELGFTVNSGSVKSDKLRRSDTDIRKERFHVAGSEAVDGQVLPYRLAIEWHLRENEINESKPELELLGKLAHLNHPDTKHLNEAIVAKCSTEEDFNFILDIVMKNIFDDKDNENTF